jgi:hypothetical protein
MARGVSVSLELRGISETDRLYTSIRTRAVITDYRP